MTQPAYLIPCTAAECPNTRVSTEEDKDKMGPLCSRTHKEGAVATDVTKGFGTNTLTTTFFAPLTPAASYIVCVPYCFKDGGCKGSAVSWALVDSNTPIKILPANPSSYTIDPKSPYTLTFTGTDLKAGDKIRILAKGQVARGLLCPNPSSAEMPNTEYTHEYTTTSIPKSDGTITFSIDAKHAAAPTGQMCYSRGGQQWAPVFQTAEKTPLYFSLENADVPTLYQEVRVKIRRGSPDAADPNFADGDEFKARDEFYFMEAVEEKSCEVSHSSGTVLTVKEVGPDGTFAVASVVIKNPEFTVGKTYKICYIRKGGGVSPKVYEASATLIGVDTPVSFTVLSSIYTTHVTNPPTVYAGQGPVELTITNADQEASGKAFGKKKITQLPYLMPCTNEDCSDKNDIAALCSKDTTDNKGIVTTGAVTGFGTGKLTTTFFAPAAASTKSYMICVPYCFKTGSCQGNDVSWALVNSNPPIKILPANPSSYTYKRGSKTLIFTGSGLKEGDKIRILTAKQAATGELCIFSSSALSNSEFTHEKEAICPTSDTRSSVSKFTLATSEVTALTRGTKDKGQVCYSRKDSPNVWAPVIQTEDKTALYFSLENADAPTLYQEVRVKIRKCPNGDDAKFVFKETDKFYFIDTSENCITNPTCEAAVGKDEPQICKLEVKDVTLWSVKVEKSSDGAYAMATIVIKSVEFKERTPYKMCYVKKDTGDSCGVLYEATYTLTTQRQTPASFTIQSSIYTEHETNPTTVYAGQGPVTLTIGVAADRAKGNKETTQRPYLIPCASNECTNKFSPEDKFKDKLASLCSKDKIDGAVTTGEVTGGEGAVQTSVVTGFGTGKLTTTFFTPVTPAAAYMVCVPYCFKDGKCSGSDVSWALVNSDDPIEFLPANPLSYTIDTKSPKTLTFTGTGLKAGDKIRIVPPKQAPQEGSTKGEFCVFTSAASSENGEYTEEATATTDTSGTRSVSKFTLRTPLPTQFTGKVCYLRKDKHELWAPVTQTKRKTSVSDPIIPPKGPTGFTFLPASPEIGKELELTFTGTDGLTAQDSSYLVTCAPEVTNLQPSTGILPDICDNANKPNQYTCDITKDRQDIKCKAHITPRATNSGGLRLCVCYKKSGQSNYALVPGNVDVHPKAKTPAETPAGTPEDEPAPLKPDPPEQTPQTEPKKKDKDEGPVKKVKPDSPKTDKDEPEKQHINPKDKPDASNPDPSAEIPPKKPIPPKTEKEAKTDPPKNEQVPPKKKEIPPNKPETSRDPKQDGEVEKKDKAAEKTVTPNPDTVPKLPKTDVPTDKYTDVNKSSTLSATAILSTIPAVLITSVVFLYLYKY